ncbi:Lanthionine synthetase C-like protein [Nesidiocoris tenuis]|uniref:Lanthionine synthetase C-like protein n=1 Tax=Nesidiocoris tenuis TaxID=355587 RepID=A0ABN7AYV6_9HEMI|nr:Lanthionine synthetase C-like protein [Nesidiocoris tenuis]
MPSSKFYEPLEDFSESKAVKLVHDEKISRSLLDKASKVVGALNQKLDAAIAAIKDDGDRSVYTGSCGIALYHYMLFKKFGSEANYAIAKSLVANAVKHLKGRRISFLTGDAGPLALAAVFNHLDGLQSEADKAVHKLVRLGRNAPSDTPDEMLYGWAGYVYGLSFVNRQCNRMLVPEDKLVRAIGKIIDHGASLATERKVDDPPLMWEWHGKNYLGAAHGVAGILYMLLKHIEWLSTRDKDMLIKPTLDWLIKQRYDTGNFKSSFGTQEDRLVQWCHGAPGFTSLLLLASEVYNDDKYANLAVETGEIIWNRGLLKKGYSLCHGVAGNGYAFVQLYQKTKEPKYLYRAASYMDWCLSHPAHQKQTPDRPNSLYEGIAGVLYFLKDLEDPMTAAFPGFDFGPDSPINVNASV